MTAFKKLIAILMVCLLLIPSAFSLADGEGGTSANLTGDSSSSSGSEIDVDVGDDATLVADETGETTSEYSETDEYESEEDSESGTDTSSTEASSSTNSMLDTIANKLSPHAGGNYGGSIYKYTPQSQSEERPGFILVENIEMPVSTLESIAKEGKKISKSVKNKDNDKNPIAARGLATFGQYQRLLLADSFGDGALSDGDGAMVSQDLYTWTKYINGMNSARAHATTSWPSCPIVGVDVDALYDTLPEAELQDLEDLLDELDNIPTTTIEGIGGARRAKDFYTYYDRYNALSKYVSLCKMADVRTVGVQHVVEFCVQSVTQTITLTETPCAYPAGIGYGDGTGMFAWTVECLESEYDKDVGDQSFIGTTKDKYLNYTFSTAGKYRFTYSQNIRKVVSGAVSYNIYEYWYIASTRQIIYRRESTGGINRSKNGGVERAAGRSGDKLTAYIGTRVEYAYMTESNDIGVLGREMGSIIVNAKASALQIIPDMGVFDEGRYTHRIG